MLATLKGRDTKAELNRRRQACEVLADTGIRVARNGLPSRSLAREWEGCLRSSSLGSATSPHSVGRRLVEHQGSAPCIPVWLAIRSSERESERPSVAESYGGHPSLLGSEGWKTGVYLSTPMLGEMESRAGIAPASAVLQTAA